MASKPFTDTADDFVVDFLRSPEKCGKEACTTRQVMCKTQVLSGKLLQVIDVGTDNLALRNDEYYLGLHQPRVKGNRYYEILDEVTHLQEVRPNTSSPVTMA